MEVCSKEKEASHEPSRLSIFKRFYFKLPELLSHQFSENVTESC